MPKPRPLAKRRADPIPAYPRPQLRRAGWTRLDGEWDFAIDAGGEISNPATVHWTTKIQVPFAPETPASGIGRLGFMKAVWYRRTFTAPRLEAGQRLILHFNAVDFSAAVWVNDSLVVRHEGGYTPFSADITDALSADAFGAAGSSDDAKNGSATDAANGARIGAPQTIIVRAEDDPHDLAKPRGKQDWLEHAHSIWYPRTTGIWQSVWLEVVPAVRVAQIRWTPSMPRWDIGVEVRIEGRIERPSLDRGEGRFGRQIDGRDGGQLDGRIDAPAAAKLRVKLTARDTVLADDVYAIAPSPHLGPGVTVSRRIVLEDPGIGDGREFLLWWPHRPTLIEAQIDLLAADGAVLDSVESYTAMRSVSLQGDRFMLNGLPYTLQLVLNQGYWPESGLTAPDDDALRRDVELVKSLGFNGVRLHQKIENPRFLYWADRLGLCVWEEMPSCYAFSKRSIERTIKEWTSAVERDISHPCIVAWVPINESWGVPDLPEIADQRHFTRAMYHLTKSLDPSRPVIGNDGWESIDTDIIAIHDYDRDPERLGKRYALSESNVAHLFKRERPGGRALVLGDVPAETKPIMLTEFGGIAFSKDTAGATWGYTRAESAEALAQQYYHLLDVVRGLPLFCGFCYTQFTDTYQEANGLLYMDRTPKFPVDQIATATRGPRGTADQKIEMAWRKRAFHLRRKRDEETGTGEDR